MLNEQTVASIIAALERQERILLEQVSPKARQTGKTTAVHGLVSTQNALALMRAIQKGDTIASLWSLEDVYALDNDEEGDSTGLNITDAQARDTLRLALEEHDAEVGINWDVLRNHLEYVQERQED